VFDKFFLYLSAAVEIQMKVDGCRLDVVMAQVVSNICERVAAQEHVDRPGMAEAVDGIDRFKVVIDSSTTSQQDILNNTIRGKIFLKPTKSIEWISLDFVAANNINQ